MHSSPESIRRTSFFTVSCTACIFCPTRPKKWRYACVWSLLKWDRLGGESCYREMSGLRVTVVCRRCSMSYWRRQSLRATRAATVLWSGTRREVPVLLCTSRIVRACHSHAPSRRFFAKTTTCIHTSYATYAPLSTDHIGWPHWRLQWRDVLISLKGSNFLPNQNVASIHHLPS